MSEAKINDKSGMVSARYSEDALKEKEYLKEANKMPLLKRWKAYLKLTGPAAMEAATTLGAGSFTAAVTMGAVFGYKMLWIPFYSYGIGLFMLALATRYVVASETPIIEAQNKYHSKFIGSFATGIIACYLASVVFSFGQYALGADALQSLFSLVGINFPRQINWIVIAGISTYLALLYGKGGSTKYVKIVENVMKALIGIMLLTFLAIIFKTGINWKEAFRGILIPTLPKGVEGITVAIAGLTAAMGIMDWVQFHYAMHARGYSEEHEKVSRFDTIVGGWIPVTIVLGTVSIAFAEAFAGKEGIPTSSSDLATALVGILPSIWIKLGFYIGIIALVISTMVGMSIMAATTFCQSAGLPIDQTKWYWKVLILTPQLGFLGAMFGKPIWVVITVAAMQSLFNWISGISWYLLGNDKRYLGEKRVKNRVFNAGVLVSVMVLNLVFITFVLSKLGVWPQ